MSSNHKSKGKPVSLFWRRWKSFCMPWRASDFHLQSIPLNKCANGCWKFYLPSISCYLCCSWCSWQSWKYQTYWPVPGKSHICPAWFNSLKGCKFHCNIESQYYKWNCWYSGWMLWSAKINVWCAKEESYAVRYITQNTCQNIHRWSYTPVVHSSSKASNSQKS